MNYLISPSLERANLLNLEKDIKNLESCGVDLLHFDIAEPIFSGTTLLMPDLIPLILEITEIPLDIHLLVSHPEMIVDLILPFCKNNYVSFHPETTYNSSRILKKINDAGGKGSISLLIGTPILVIEELLPFISMINLCIREDNFTEEIIHPRIFEKIRETRKYLSDRGFHDVKISVDGSVTFEDAKELVRCGADILVLGRKTIFNESDTIINNYNKLKKFLNSNF